MPRWCARAVYTPRGDSRLAAPGRITGTYGFLNTIPTQLSCERHSSKLKPAAPTALAVSLARVTTEPLVMRAPACRRVVARFGASSIITLGKIFATTKSKGGAAD